MFNCIEIKIQDQNNWLFNYNIVVSSIIYIDNWLIMLDLYLRIFIFLSETIYQSNNELNTIQTSVNRLEIVILFANI